MAKTSIDKTNNIQEITLESFKGLSHDSSSIENFYKGIYCLYANQLVDSKNHFLEALNGTNETETSYFEYLSFLGISEVLLSKSQGGLSRCYEASQGISTDPNLYLNIAYAEYILENRRRSVIAIESFLEHDKTHTYAHFFNECMIKRSEKNKHRNSVAQNIVGRLFRKKKSCSEEKFVDIFKDYLSRKLDTYMKEILNK